MNAISVLCWLWSLTVAQAPHSEADWATEIRLHHLAGSRQEVVLFDRTRVDLVWQDYAIEIDWATKWAESVGQSRYYARATNLTPAIILLTNDVHADAPFIHRAIIAADKGVVWVFDCDSRKFVWPGPVY